MKKKKNTFVKSDKDLMTLEELAKRLGVAVGTIYNWRSQGVEGPLKELLSQMKHLRIGGRPRLYLSVAYYEKWFRKHMEF